MEIVIFKNFQKRKNSTLQPNMASGTHKDVKLKGATSLRNPTFLMSDLDWTTESANYVWWNNRFYFVDDITYLNNNEYAMSCTIDVLATYKSQIGAYNCFVERSESEQTAYVEDMLVTAPERKSYVNTAKTQLISGDPDIHPKGFSQFGCYLVRTFAPPVSSQSSLGIQTGITTYCVPMTEMYALLNYTFDENNYSNVMTDQMVKAVFNPSDYIIDVKWVPYWPSILSGTTTTSKIKLGWWETTANGYPIQNLSLNWSFSLSRPNAQYSDFRQVSPRFTEDHLFIPGVGLIDLDPREFLNPVYLIYHIDCTTGDASVELSHNDTTFDNGEVFATYQATLSAPIRISQSAFDLQGVTSDVISTVGNAFAGNYAGSVASLVDVVPTLLQPTTSSIGSQGNISSIANNLSARWINIQSRSCDVPNTCGHPLYMNRTIGNLSGYIKCGNASVNISGCDADKDEVNAYLNSGFYFE